MQIKKYKINLIFFLFSIVLIASFLFFEILFISKNLEKTTLKNAVAKAQERSEIILDFADQSHKELASLKGSKAFKSCLATGLCSPAENLFKTFVDSHETYTRLRYLDANGDEKIRISRDSKGLVTIVKTQAQKRPGYFTEAKDKTPNRTWFTALDLSQEDASSGPPFQPETRAVMPLENVGQFNGLLVADYSMKTFLDKLFYSCLYDMILVNHKGEILKHHQADKSWSRYTDPGYTLYDEFGAEAEHIFAHDIFTGEHFVSNKVDMDIQDGLILLLKMKHDYIDIVFQQQIGEYITIAVVVFILSLIANIFISNIVKNINRDLTQTKTLNSKLNELNTLLNDAQSIAKIGFWEFNIDDGVIYWSDEIYRIFGLEDTTIKPTYAMFLSYIHPDDRQRLNTQYQNSVEQKRDYHTRHRVISASGELKYVEERAQHYYDDSGRHIKSVGSIYNRTEETLSHNKINHYLKLIDENIISSSTDLAGTITQVSQAFCAICEYSKEEMVGQKHSIIKCLDTDAKIYTQMWSALTKDRIWQGELRNRKKSGGFYWSDITIYPDFDDQGKKTGYTAIRHDITEKKILEQLAITDAMTKLYNRRHFNDIFPKIINSAKRKNELFSFMIIDIDYFKQYNDTYGHQAGDDALIAVAGVIDNCLQRADDYAFRLGGEEFGVIYRPSPEEKHLAFAQKIKNAVEALAIPHEKSSVSNQITVSIGLVTKNARDIESNDLLYKETDDALYRAKNNGRNQIASNISV